MLTGENNNFAFLVRPGEEIVKRDQDGREKSRAEVRKVTLAPTGCRNAVHMEVTTKKGSRLNWCYDRMAELETA